MSCQRYQVDLSRCLDGRLPGARRAEVMAHVDQCPNCEQVWADMQAAQALIFGLDQPRVGPDFRDRVWDRIHSGEGAPEVLLQEPLSTWSKVRYGLVGAAAAAVFLFTLHLVTRGDSAGTTSSEQVANAPVLPKPGPDVTTVDSTGNPPDGTVRIDEAASDPFVTSTLAASQLAHATAQRVTSAARQLRSKRHYILQHSRLEQPLLQQINHYVRIIDDGLQVLDRLQRREFVSFEPSSRDCLISVRNSLNLDQDPVKKTYNLVRTLSDCSLDSLDQQLKYTISMKQVDQQRQMLFGMLAEPKLRRILTELHILKNEGTVQYLMLQSSELPNGFFQLPMGSPQEFRLRLVPAPEADRKAPPKRLTRRND